MFTSYPHKPMSNKTNIIFEMIERKKDYFFEAYKCHVSHALLHCSNVSIHWNSSRTSIVDTKYSIFWMIRKMIISIRRSTQTSGYIDRSSGVTFSTKCHDHWDPNYYYFFFSSFSLKKKCFTISFFIYLSEKSLRWYMQLAISRHRNYFFSIRKNPFSSSKSIIIGIIFTSNFFHFFLLFFFYLFSCNFVCFQPKPKILRSFLYEISRSINFSFKLNDTLYLVGLSSLVWCLMIEVAHN